MCTRKVRPRLKLALTVIGALFLALVFLTSPGYATTTFSDDLRGTTLNPYAWQVELVGGVVGVASPQPDGLHLRLFNKGTTRDFGVVVDLVPVVAGDFDASVDFRLVKWPTMNGARVTISSPFTAGIVERTSFSINDAFLGEYYVTNFMPVGDLQLGLTPTSDTQGRLRFTRVGNTYAGYWWDGSGWVLIRSFIGRPTGQITDLSLVLASTDYRWQGQEVEVILENFTITADSIAPMPLAFRVLLPLVQK